MGFEECVAKKVSETGYAVISRLDPMSSTEIIALKLGSVVDVSSLLPGVPKVQTLRPQKPAPWLMNQYSGVFGTEDFPLHSDLAHWYLPPRYILLRCRVGVKDVETKLVSYSTIDSVVGAQTLKRALVVPRRKCNTQTICPLPVVFSGNESWGFRWDSLFLSPLNGAAKNMYRMMTSRGWSNEEVIRVKLQEPGDTMIVDNWRMLHGRSAVPDGSMNRVIERVYLNRLGGEL